MACPSCDGPLRLTGASSQVDRVIPERDYEQSNICYLCETCNQHRGVLQSRGRDWTHVGRYAADVARASEGIDVPSRAEAARQWAALRDAGARASKYA